MNSAVEPLLKAINDLSGKVSMLEAEKGELIRRITNLECDIRDLRNSMATNSYTWNTPVRTGISTPYGRSITDREAIMGTQSYISDLNSNNDGTLTITYADGRTETINPVL